ncbi:MAG: Sapep family Mn(2+)-dependent dipeptidase, partial [Oscillospiraceae bacterium]|nr:Sapep family Mn(2+)-dependent dipeptidase [Oscillospiraceae bacterium]
MDKIFSYIDSHADEMIADLRRLVRIPSVMGEAAEGAPFGAMPARALEDMLDMCSEAGLYVRNIDGYVGTADLYPAVKTPEVGILCHLDVVPEGSGWSFPPYDLTEKNGKLFGRGAIDDKGPAAAVLQAVKALKAAGVKPEKNLRLIFGTNEENGSSDLAYYRKREKLPEMLFTPDGSYPIINAEKGMLRVSYRFKADSAILALNGGNAVNAVPEYAEAVLDIPNADVSAYSEKFEGVTISAEHSDNKTKITAKGKGAHASTPENGANAVTALLSAVSEICGDPKLSALSKMFPYGETDGSAAGIKCSDKISGGLTTV